jgi:hypothetical protein
LPIVIGCAESWASNIPMRALVDRFGWKPLDTAPFDQDATLMVSDGRGTPYALKSPFRLTAAGWVSANKGTPLAVTPLQWKLYFPIPNR